MQKKAGKQEESSTAVEHILLSPVLIISSISPQWPQNSYPNIPQHESPGETIIHSPKLVSEHLSKACTVLLINLGWCWGCYLLPASTSPLSFGRNQLYCKFFHISSAFSTIQLQKIQTDVYTNVGFIDYMTNRPQFVRLKSFVWEPGQLSGEGNGEGRRTQVQTLMPTGGWQENVLDLFLRGTQIMAEPENHKTKLRKTTPKELTSLTETKTWKTE